jgi:RNA:NAD 2'-phosphotransferase (TPT1/KptA family)
VIQKIVDVSKLDGKVNRFQIKTVDSDKFIRATYGHSIKTVDPSKLPKAEKKKTQFTYEKLNDISWLSQAFKEKEKEQ